MFPRMLEQNIHYITTHNVTIIVSYIKCSFVVSFKIMYVDVKAVYMYVIHKLREVL